MNKAAGISFLMVGLSSSTASAQGPGQASEKAGNTQKSLQKGTSESSVATFATVATNSADNSLTNLYRVGVGDVLDVRVKDLGFSGSTLFTVLDGGFIDFPVIGGTVAVAGLTTDEIQALVTSEFKPRALQDAPQVTVGVRQFASHTVIVTGLVVSGGTKILRREAGPLYIVLSRTQARLDAARATIMRADVPTIIVDL